MGPRRVEGEFVGYWYDAWAWTPHNRNSEEATIAASLFDRRIWLAWILEGIQIVAPIGEGMAGDARGTLRVWG